MPQHTSSFIPTYSQKGFHYGPCTYIALPIADLIWRKNWHWVPTPVQVFSAKCSRTWHETRSSSFDAGSRLEFEFMTHNTSTAFHCHSASLLRTALTLLKFVSPMVHVIHGVTWRSLAEKMLFNCCPKGCVDVSFYHYGALMSPTSSAIIFSVRYKRKRKNNLQDKGTQW